MNPLLSAALGSIFRWLLTFVSAYLVSRGIWTEEAATTYVAAAAVGLVTLAWSLYQKYRDKILLNTAAAAPKPVSVEEVKAMISVDKFVPASVPENRIPYLPGAKPLRYSTDPPAA